MRVDDWVGIMSDPLTSIHLVSTGSQKMNATIHEVDFTSQAAGWINQLAEANGNGFPIGSAKIETLSAGSRKRRDLTIYDRSGQPILTGEVKLPWAVDGYSPFIEATVTDAKSKALSAGVSWFFTWNVNELLLWQLDGVGALGSARTVERFVIGNIQKKSDLENSRQLKSIRSELEKFVVFFSRIFLGEQGIESRPPDLYFVHSLESFLERPIALTLSELSVRYENQRERDRLDRWMRDRQGWVISGDEDELLLRAARFTNYTAINRLIFYEALRKRYASLPGLEIGAHITEGESLFESFRAYFDEARAETGDYETVFGVDPSDVGDRIPFYDSSVIDSWRELCKHIHLFDFSSLDYDVIGQIFENLIGPEERHKYGQYYTRPEVVDLINSFCIRDGDDVVMDPGCGGGTFLVRAYARKKFLSPRLGHPKLLEGIFGVDQSRFASHLSTINLASRDLIDSKNYPRVRSSDFFDVNPDSIFITLPGVDGSQTEITSPRLDAVVANPPYVRQEDIPKPSKDRYQKLVRSAAGLEAGGRSDLHVYFWGHATNFLKPGGRLGFLTSSQWLDVEYGFALQKFLLNRFKIRAIIESRSEPWFVGARVQTAVTIAELETKEEVREQNNVAFVQLRRPLLEILSSDGTSAGAISASDELRDFILNCSEDHTDENMRIRIVPQSELIRDGEKNGLILKGAVNYLGSKWGIPLRAPDIWDELRGLSTENWKPLGELAEVRFGIKTGNDKFFYLTDVTDKTLEKTGDPIDLGSGVLVSREDVISGRVKIVESLSGEHWPIESEFLAPVVHSLMHIDAYEVTTRNCKKLALMVSRPIDELGGTHVADYIARGEELGVHRGATVASRANARPWYDLTNARYAPLLWAKSHQYRHCAPINSNEFAANCNLYTVEVKGDEIAAAGVLNSTVVLLAKHLYGRPVGVEANLKTEVIDVNIMPVPDWTAASPAVLKRIISAMKRLQLRKVEGLLSERRLKRQTLLQKGQVDKLEQLSELTEFDFDDRHELDDAVLELIGISNPRDRVALRDRLYSFLKDHFENLRTKEEEAIGNKKKAKRQAKITPGSLASDVFNEIEKKHPSLLAGYREFAKQAGDVAKEGIRVPSKGEPELVDDMLMTGVRFKTSRTQGELVQTRSVEQSKLVKLIFEIGNGGRSHFVPIEEAVLSEQISLLETQLRSRLETANRLIEARTADPELAMKALDLVLSKF